MTHIVKYLWNKVLRPVSPTFSFDPFDFEEEFTIEPQMERMLDFIDDFDDPFTNRGNEVGNARPMRPELQHPRPVRKVALQNALSTFEEMAQSSDSLPGLLKANSPGYSSNGSTSSMPSQELEPHGLEDYPAVKPRSDAVPASFLPVQGDHTTATAIDNERFNGSEPLFPEPHPSALRASGGLACLSPGFLEHFPGHERARPPMPTFVLSRSTASQTSSVPSPAPATLSRATDSDGENGAQGEDCCLDHECLDSFEKPDADLSWSSGWNEDGSFSVDAQADSSLLSAATDEYFGDDESSESSTSDSPRASPSLSPFRFTSPSPDFLAYDGPTVRLVPRQAVTADDELNPPIPEGGFDNATLLALHWLRMADEATTANFVVR